MLLASDSKLALKLSSSTEYVVMRIGEHVAPNPEFPPHTIASHWLILRDAPPASPLSFAAAPAGLRTNQANFAMTSQVKPSVKSQDKPDLWQVGFA